MAFTDVTGIAAAAPGNIELGIGAVPAIPPSPTSIFFTGVLQNRFTAFKVVQRATTQLTTVPDSFDVWNTETYPYVVDVTNYLGTGDSVSNVSAVLIQLPYKNVVTASWNGGSSISGNVITIPIIASVLSIGQQYEIVVTFTASSSKVATYASFLQVNPNIIAASQGTITSLSTLPGQFVVAVTETAWPYSVNVANYLIGTDTITNVNPTLMFAGKGIAVAGTWNNSVTISNNYIITNINVSKLHIGQSYQIVTTFTANTNKVVAFVSILKVVA